MHYSSRVMQLSQCVCFSHLQSVSPSDSTTFVTSHYSSTCLCLLVRPLWYEPEGLGTCLVSLQQMLDEQLDQTTAASHPGHLDWRDELVFYLWDNG